MGLAEALSKRESAKPLSCTLTKIIQALPENEAGAVIDALESTMTSEEIHKALRMNGYRISNNTVRDHRRKTCACYWGTK